ncbi:MAG: hypothetical protein ACRDZU_16515 [Acidimicrobiales bacterium]
MTTLHLEVTVNDVAAFKSGFADHTETRRQAGVRAEQVRHPIGDDSLLLVDLDFDSVEQAEAFLGFLKENIWKDNPALVGTPVYKILEPVTVV